MTAADLYALKIAIAFDHSPDHVRVEVAEFIAGFSAYSRGIAGALVGGCPGCGRRHANHDHARVTARRAGA